MIEYAKTNNLDLELELYNILQEAIWNEIEKETSITQDKFDLQIKEKLRKIKFKMDEKK